MTASTSAPFTIYNARKILTLDARRPAATHVAVRDGRILGVGALADLQGWGEHVIDDRFADLVLMPGLIEGHCHLMAGSLWRYTYCGYFDLADHTGCNWPGAKTLDAVVAALRNAGPPNPNIPPVPPSPQAHPDDKPVLGWGFDPIYFGGRRCNRHDLDQVSDTQPVGLFHASAHILNVNSVALQRAGLLRTGIDHPGIPLGPDGLPTGELKGPEAMLPVMGHVGINRAFLSGDTFGLQVFGRLCVRAGVTTATDLAASMEEAELLSTLETTSAPGYPVRIVSMLRMFGMSPTQTVEKAFALKARSTNLLRLGAIKVVADGSIQGFSARLRWPGYYNGAPNGLWYTAPEAIRECYVAALRHGLQVHTHTNGDEATDLALDCLTQALKESPRFDHRFMLQHVQMADAAQFRRMKALGMGVNLFANHHFYWGDQHRDITLGPERAERMNACATALDEGVPIAIHSDAPITPLSPLFTAWCAVNRLTATGRVLGAAERITVDQALRAITLGAAWSLGLDSEMGSISAGKRADFCVLHDDPQTVGAEHLKDVKVWGTVQDGRVFEA